VNTKVASITILLLLPAFIEAQQVAKCPQSGPLSEAQLTELVKGSVPAPRIGQFVASCGIDFEPTEDAIGRLRSAGAPESVLAAVRAATGPTERKRQEEKALWESTKDSQDPSVYEDYLRRYPEGQYAGLARQKCGGLKVAGMRTEIERAIAASQWDAADEKIRDLLRLVSDDDEIRGWQRRVADGRDLDEVAERADTAYAQQDYATAAPLYRQLADSGRALAMARLGRMYSIGRGVARDNAQAVAWCRKAAEEGEPEGMVNLGSSYQLGEGVTRDYVQAVAWFRKAAEKGDRLGMNHLGFMYEHGYGVTEDDTQAVAWFRKAAEKGEPWSMNTLGVMYAQGRGVAQDDIQSAAWYRKAAESGNSFGMNNLGSMYESGRGVVKDMAEAIAWYRKAAALGNWGAKSNLKRLGQ
jgi:TPR repeat protein